VITAMMAACLLVFLSTAASGQAAAGAQAFDVASVKLTRHGRTADGWSYSDLKVAGPRRFVATNASLDECIRWAYEVKEYQVSGPDWLNSDAASYDIEAKASPDTTEKQIRLMMRTLLAERFKLMLHSETRMLPVYTLVVAKNGPRLQAAGSNGSDGLTSEGSRERVRVTAQKATMAGLAHRLSLDLGRPVVDRTGLGGAFRITLEWAREGDGPSVFTAIQELGLKLEGTKSPIEVLVIDRAEKVPTAN